MNRASVARLAVRAYPAGARQTGDAEIMSTLLDAGDASGAAFLRELISMFLSGLAQRAAHAQRIRPCRLLVGALIYGGLTLSAWMAGHMSYVAAPTTGSASGGPQASSASHPWSYCALPGASVRLTTSGPDASWRHFSRCSSHRESSVLGHTGSVA
jgi:hypothetical protein